MSAAQMRKMMEGVVLFGTGKKAQLNGYSSGGKTGTAQKVDPHTHLYSKTMHVASFAGIAPVNNPVISVAVVIDTPKGPSYYGAEVSAPVFAEVAQQVLEYLRVPHDIDIRPAKPGKPQQPVHEDDEDNAPDINSLFAAVNDLPEDDPLRASSPVPAASPASGCTTCIGHKTLAACRHSARANGDGRTSATLRGTICAFGAKGRRDDRRRRAQGSNADRPSHPQGG